MSKSKHAPGYVPNDAYGREDWDEVSDNPPLTHDELSRLRPGTEGMPAAMAAAFKSRGGRPKAETRRVPISLRVDPDVLAAYKADGPGWQTRMNDVLTEAVLKTPRRRDVKLPAGKIVLKPGRGGARLEAPRDAETGRFEIVGPRGGGKASGKARKSPKVA